MNNEEILRALDNVINDNKNTEVLTGNLNVYNMASSCKFKILDLIEENKRLNKDLIKHDKLITKLYSEICLKQQEVNRLNNIINECAEDILKEIEENHHLSCGVALTIRQKLIDYREIKGSDKE